jgi:hypothetical protein
MASLAMTPTDNPSIDLIIYITAWEEYYEITNIAAELLMAHNNSHLV